MNDQGPPPPEKTPLAMARQIDQIVSQFEIEIRAGRSARIEDYLSSVAAEHQAKLLEQLLFAELDGAHSRPALTLEQYRDRFPAYASVVQLVFDRLNTEATVQLPGDRVSTAGSSQGGRNSFTLRAQIPHEMPRQLGQYLIRDPDADFLGEGSFGFVFRGWDLVNQRFVALKFPSRTDMPTQEEMDELLGEASAARRLEHDGIVKTYEVGQFGGYVFIVQQLVEGTTLKQVMSSYTDNDEIARLVTAIADALDAAHRQRIYHRDIKPSNILLDAERNPHIADFGLAIDAEASLQRKGERAGSPPYMSPELVRGETNLIDGRCDIWSLGVVFYQLLVGELPFPGQPPELYEQIQRRDLVPQQFKRGIPDELLRICLKCLSKRISERYSTAASLKEDLDAWIERKSSDRREKLNAAATIIPRGLRSYGTDDHDFFLQMLPGPRDRDGIPDSIRIWQRRIEPGEREEPFAVGALFGPSGSGKSSFLKAGLLPQLDRRTVLPLYVECTAADTGVRIIKAVRREFPQIPSTDSLPEILKSLRQGKWSQPGRKVLLVLDQFEQWLYANRDAGVEDQLAQGLRQCDGDRLQCLLSVRDDFWSATSRFMHVLDRQLSDETNCGRIERLSLAHAKKILTALGRAYGRLPAGHNPSSPQQAFLDQAVSRLAENNRIICVHLSLFAEMFKDRPWTKTELDTVADISVVGETFLEEAFCAKNAPPNYKVHEKAARAVLQALLPPPGTEIRGHMQSREKLADVSTYAGQPARFEQLIAALDQQLRLITPTDPDTAESTAVAAGNDSSREQGDHFGPRPPARYFQLTHDYLVPSIRQWLTRHESWAQRRLAELASQYQRSGQKRFVPSLLEYVPMTLRVSRRTMNAPEKQLMQLADRRHALTLGAAALLGAGALGAWWLIQRSLGQRKMQLLVQQLVGSEPFAFEQLFAEVKPYGTRPLPQLELHQADSSAQNRINALCAAARIAPQNRSYLYKLVEQIHYSKMDQAGQILTCLSKNRHSASMLSEQFVNNQEVEQQIRLSIALIDLGETFAAKQMLAFGLDESVRTQWIHQFKDWHGSIDQLIGALDWETAPVFVSAVCLAIGTLAHQMEQDQSRMRVVRRVASVFAENMTAVCHASARFALRRLNVQEPTVPEGMRPGFDWYTGPGRLTFVRVPQGKLYQGWGIPEQADPESTIPKRALEVDEFWISDTEVPVRLFQEFLNDQQYPGAKPDPMLEMRSVEQGAETPASGVSALDAMHFCNWLSWKAGKSNCYSLRDDAWQLDTDQDGYRLPRHAELEYACRAGTNTSYFFGDMAARIFLGQYAWINNNSSSPTGLRPQDCGTRMPNSFGLFDTLGNVSEFCCDPSPPAEETDRPAEDGGENNRSPLRGLLFIEYANHYASNTHHFCGWYLPTVPMQRIPSSGFRVVHGRPKAGR